MRISVIDIGSNTAKSAIYEASNEVVCVGRKTVYLGLFSYIENKKLTKKGQSALIGVLDQLKSHAIASGCEKIFVFATAALRMSENKDEILKRVKDELDISIDLISGDTEARLTFESAVQSTAGMADDGICVDLGGGSCEIIFFKDKKICDLVSFPLGSLLLYKKHVAEILPTKDEYEKILAHALSLFNTKKEVFSSSNVYLIGGTSRAIFKVACERNGQTPPLPCKISLDVLEGLRDGILARDYDTKMSLIKNVPERIHTFAPGLATFIGICQKCGATEITVTDASVRDGYLKERLAKND